MKYTVQKANQFFKGDKPIPVGGDIDLEDNVLTRKFVERGHVEAPASGGTVSGKQEYRPGESASETTINKPEPDAD
ncbi:hypothetical protein [uncultured Hyphomonas sp.]|uniref:hypothetical protein n=1 Tax=uncultured Hyphomonas sp. TaxID=225298 RepID=UPI000C363A54|nr:hypothetical protein [Hyphomonadaceae bacterium]MBA30094.1 hypothetical protein [Hyphomonadaceae bacterium]QDP63722.1 MAG: hypothetical protein GOVbin258_50 [Prokaryotic dsDNA virus sp.]|tara:strand:- start:17293 stop:17520 length:228 start_codon:yes stop_codon:yes gene_type:complete